MLIGAAGAHAAYHGGKNGKIVFVKGGDLWVLGPSGPPRPLTGTSKREEADPGWSPDGRRLAYTVDGLVYVANADGTGATDITSPSIKGDPNYYGGGCDSQPTWSPDGKEIAVSAITNGCTGAAGEIDAVRLSDDD